MGFDVLDEAFIDMPNYDLHPQTLTMESMWVSHWMQRLLEKKKSSGNTHQIFFADRSPFSAVFYSKKEGQLLEPLISAQIAELRECDIFIYSIYVEVGKEVLWERICRRLEREPHRKKYNEESRAWMEKTVEFYEERKRLWDFTLSNDEEGIGKLASTLLSTLSHSVDQFTQISSLCCKKQEEAPLPSETAIG